MTYEDLVEKIAIKEGFDSTYTINNLGVKEVFYNEYLENLDGWVSWRQQADKHTIEETNYILE